MIVRPILEPFRTGLLCCVSLGLLFLPSQNPATVPNSRMAELWWKARHEHCLRLTTNYRADVAFLGDSITEGWETEGKPVWDLEIAPLRAANFGFSGDNTDHALWRLQNGELVGMNPKVVVLLIGTCNLKRGATPEDTADGVNAVVKELRQNLPNTKILLLGVFPRGQSAADEIWQSAARTDELLEQYGGDKNIQFLDIGDAFVEDDGSLSEKLFPDFVHPSRKGYEAWARAMKPKLQEMLSEGQ